MSISQTADYALRAILFIAERPADVAVQLRDIATDQKIPPFYLSKVCQSLRRAGILRSVRGKGFYLVRNLRELSVHEVIKAVDGPVVIRDCVDNPQYCVWRPTCPMVPLWTKLQRDLVATLDRTFLQELLDWKVSIRTCPQPECSGQVVRG
ncbi:MAG: Rrf2 family transcriptional regulator [Planctomycetes bacterium]|nr:Rrf2 family transcriptional regulator [Planctomycetota bacterium]